VTAYYNEIDSFAAQWLRNLIDKGLIAKGDVDERSIVDVSADDLQGYKQCHFFAGIGGWSHALRLAGWEDEKEIWTGSCPCQPFSVAGKGLGAADPRHLWPYFHRLIAAVRPPVVMGEQVAGAAGYGWLDGVRADLEREDYACRGVDIPACAVDAPHIRSRLYWIASHMADAECRGREGGAIPTANEAAVIITQNGAGSSGPSHMADAARELPHGSRREGGGRPEHPNGSNMDDTNNTRLEGQLRHGDGGSRREGEARPVATSGRSHMADADHERRDGIDALLRQDEAGRVAGNIHEAAGRRPANSFWSDHIWLTGADGRSRRAEPSIPLLAHGIPGRVGKLRAYGNAIVPPLAAEVIKAFMECEP
jgi:DNA (cytosine-5)-methyltransferase 1